MEQPVTAVYDANILYPAPLRDLLIRLARTGLFRAHWTERIQQEWVQALLRDRDDVKAERLARTCQLMLEAVPHALVTGYEDLIDGLKMPDPNDRHVLAAAIRAGDDVIFGERFGLGPDGRGREAQNRGARRRQSLGVGTFLHRIHGSVSWLALKSRIWLRAALVFPMLVSSIAVFSKHAPCLAQFILKFQFSSPWSVWVGVPQCKIS